MCMTNVIINVSIQSSTHSSPLYFNQKLQTIQNTATILFSEYQEIFTKLILVILTIYNTNWKLLHYSQRTEIFTKYLCVLIILVIYNTTNWTASLYYSQKNRKYSLSTDTY